MSSAKVSVVVAEPLGPSSSANDTVVVNYLRLETRHRLRHWRRSLRRIVYSTSSADASVVVVKYSGSSSSIDASVVVASLHAHIPRPRPLSLSYIT